MTDYSNYHDTRFGYDARRAVLWKTLAQHAFQKYLSGSNDVVVEVGAGYCDLINNIRAERRYAIDLWPRLTEQVATGVTPLVGGLQRLDELEDDKINLILASNIFEHISQADLAEFIAIARRKLRTGGRLIALQPNYRYAYADYFDDYTHVAVWSHVSLGDFFKAHGLHLERVVPRFLPLSLKSRFPIHPLLIRAYLASPVKPFGKQMLVIARKINATKQGEGFTR